MCAIGGTSRVHRGCFRTLGLGLSIQRDGGILCFVATKALDKKMKQEAARAAAAQQTQHQQQAWGAAATALGPKRTFAEIQVRNLMLTSIVVFSALVQLFASPRHFS